MWLGIVKTCRLVLVKYCCSNIKPEHICKEFYLHVKNPLIESSNQNCLEFLREIFHFMNSHSGKIWRICEIYVFSVIWLFNPNSTRLNSKHTDSTYWCKILLILCLCFSVMTLWCFPNTKICNTTNSFLV